MTERIHDGKRKIERRRVVKMEVYIIGAMTLGALYPFFRSMLT